LPKVTQFFRSKSGIRSSTWVQTPK
jgi:hypothetical protein